jgi:hypothetical protein
MVMVLVAVLLFGVRTRVKMVGAGTGEVPDAYALCTVPSGLNWIVTGKVCEVGVQLGGVQLMMLCVVAEVSEISELANG